MWPWKSDTVLFIASFSRKKNLKPIELLVQKLFYVKRREQLVKYNNKWWKIDAGEEKNRAFTSAINWPKLVFFPVFSLSSRQANKIGFSFLAYMEGCHH